jgi:hypothetical protein
LTDRKSRALSEVDKLEVFATATRVLPKWYSDAIAEGMSDAKLTAALEHVLGIFGGSCGPGRLDVAHQAAGLKIWGGWYIVNLHTEAPLFQGAKTIAMARYVYSITDPDEDQMSLF